VAAALAAALLGAALLAGCSSGSTGARATDSTTPTATVTASGQPAAVRPDHVLVVVFENKAFSQLDGAAEAPYFNALMAGSAVFTASKGVTHPSQPNYIALFSGATHGVTDDHCPVRLTGQPNLARQLLDAGLTFTGYSEAQPSVGFTGCSAGTGKHVYAAKHNPWVDFDNVPAALNQPAAAFPSDYAQLPTVSFLVPDLCDDMHDCSLATGDAWARQHLDPYVTWARSHNSLLILTFDEDDSRSRNQILTLFSGAGIAPGRYPTPIDHYSVLGTIEHWYGLPALGAAAKARVIDEVWQR